MTRTTKETVRDKSTKIRDFGFCGGLRLLGVSMVVILIAGGFIWKATSSKRDEIKSRAEEHPETTLAALEEGELIGSTTLAARYLALACEESGFFVHTTPLTGDHGAPLKGLLYDAEAHAGAVAALAGYVRAGGSAEAASALARAATFLESMVVPAEPDEPPTAPRSPSATFGLGAEGFGMAIVALLEAEQTSAYRSAEGMLPGLGERLLRLQRDDGGFFQLEQVAESALGLAALYSASGDERFLDGSARALLYLAASREDRHVRHILPDYWSVIATPHVSGYLKKRGRDEDVILADTLEKSAVRVCHRILLEREKSKSQWQKEYHHGCLTESGSAVASAQGLLALSAARPILEEHSPSLREAAGFAIEDAASFLAGLQLTNGGFPRGADSLAKRRSGEFAEGEMIRLDYVHFSLSALLAHSELRNRRAIHSRASTLTTSVN